jgi:putative DNA primase/helicase
VNREEIRRACLDPAHRGRAIYEHCIENNGDIYVRRQIKEAAEKAKYQSEAFTDLGNARRLVRLYEEDIRYVHAWRKWLVWQDGHWRKDEDGSVIRMAKSVVEQMFAEAALINDESRRTATRAHALRSQSAQRLAAMVKLAETEIEVVLPVEKLDADPHLLGVQNGVIELPTGQFRAAQRTDYITKIAGVAYDADAKCPHWDAFLKKILDKELIKYLERVNGYLLTGLTGEEVMFIPWGRGSNGKSTYRETIFALLGDYAVGAEASLLITSKKSGGATPDLARLHGRRLVTVNETEQNDHLNDSRVKFITGHDVITARNLYEEPFDFTPTHKTFLTTNHKPIVKGTDEGIWRRIHLLPFIKVIAIEERDPNFREHKLLPELPGILNRALEGLKEYWNIGLQPPAGVTDATKEYRDDMDLVGNWIEERCEVNPAAEEDTAYQETTANLHFDYEEWAKGSVGFSMSTIALGRELVNRGFKQKKVKQVRGISGLRLNLNRAF